MCTVVHRPSPCAWSVVDVVDSTQNARTNRALTKRKGLFHALAAIYERIQSTLNYDATGLNAALLMVSFTYGWW